MAAGKSTVARLLAGLKPRQRTPEETADEILARAQEAQVAVSN
jgi:hypothetical protein